jgi:PEP-CTERM motif
MRLRVASVLATVLSLAAVRDTRAATIETYDFTQGGYTSSIEPLFSGVLTGHFTGAVEASGFIELADLSSIALVFTITFELGNHQTTAFDGPTTFFSFDVAGGSSSLGLATGDGSVATACVGAAAAFGFPGCGSGGVNGSIFGGLIPFSTQAVPQVTLVSSATGGVPEPSTWAMMLLGFVGLGFAGYRASRRTAAANLRASRSQPRV